MQTGWQVCTNEGDTNHVRVMVNCPATCATYRDEPCPFAPTPAPSPAPSSAPTMGNVCTADEDELAFLMWGAFTCEDLQANWQVCTNDEDVNHEQVMRECPATCATHRGEPCPVIPVIITPKKGNSNVIISESSLAAVIAVCVLAGLALIAGLYLWNKRMVAKKQPHRESSMPEVGEEQSAVSPGSLRLARIRALFG